MDFLKRHPFPVSAHLERVVAVSFAFPVPLLRPLVPAPLEIDAYEGMGFVTVALVWTRKLRPAGFPVFLGQDFFLTGYRIFTRMKDETGRGLRGLRILRSETDKRQMTWLGNIMTGYNYHLVSPRFETNDGKARVVSTLPNGKTALDVTFDHDNREATLPEGSPFADWKTARRFAGPMPFTFSLEKSGSVVIVEGSRQNWTPRPVTIHQWRVGLFDESPFHEAKPILANAFVVENVPYYWKRGRVVKPGGIAA